MRVSFKFIGMLSKAIIFFSMKKGYKSIFRFVSILFKHDYKYDYFIVLKGVMVMFVGMSKNF